MAIQNLANTYNMLGSTGAGLVLERTNLPFHLQPSTTAKFPLLKPNVLRSLFSPYSEGIVRNWWVPGKNMHMLICHFHHLASSKGNP